MDGWKNSIKREDVRGGIAQSSCEVFSINCREEVYLVIINVYINKFKSDMKRRNAVL